jgi:hypothetical protein
MIVIFLQYEFNTFVAKSHDCLFPYEDEKEFKFDQIKTSEFLYLKKKFNEEPNITICSQVSDT